MQHKPETAPLYHVLAEIMTQLQEAGEIKPTDQDNLHLIKWDGRRKRYTYRPEENGR